MSLKLLVTAVLAVVLLAVSHPTGAAAGSSTAVPMLLTAAAGNDHNNNNNVPAPSNATVCWKGTHDRGVGTVPDSCNATAGLEKSGALCYPKCQQGYDGVGPVCWQQCKPGYIDEGALCRKKGSIVTYAKKSYGRGAGHVMTCAAGYQEDAALCYPLCPAGYYGVGPVCWESCPVVNPIDGGAICCETAVDCSNKIKELCAGLPLAVAKALLSGGNPQKIIQAVEDAINAVLGYIMPLCSQL